MGRNNAKRAVRSKKAQSDNILFQKIFLPKNDELARVQTELANWISVQRIRLESLAGKLNESDLDGEYRRTWLERDKKFSKLLELSLRSTDEETALFPAHLDPRFGGIGPVTFDPRGGLQREDLLPPKETLAYVRREVRFELESPTRGQNTDNMSRQPGVFNWKADVKNAVGRVSAQYDFNVPDIREADSDYIPGSYFVEGRIGVSGIVDIGDGGSVEVSPQIDMRLIRLGAYHPEAGSESIDEGGVMAAWRSVCWVPHQAVYRDTEPGVHAYRHDISINALFWGGTSCSVCPEGQAQALPGVMIRVAQGVTVRATNAHAYFSYNNRGTVVLPPPVIRLNRYVPE